jgi:hypothetical protein
MSLPARQERELELIEGALEASEPRLAALFAMFNRLAKGERPVSEERVRSRAWRWGRRCWQPDVLRRVAILVALATVAVSGLIIGAQVRPVNRTCAVSPTGAQSTGLFPAEARLRLTRPVSERPRAPERHGAPERLGAQARPGGGPVVPGCRGYITNK